MLFIKRNAMGRYFLQIAKDKNLPRMVSIQNVYSLVNIFDIANSEVSIREQCGLLLTRL